MFELTSNVLTGAVSSVNEHPIRAGGPLILNTDDPALFHSSVDGEFAIAKQFGFSEPKLQSITRIVRLGEVDGPVRHNVG